ncbi:MAG TPA: hypothetical protein VLS94_08875 [Fusibacter sp.]|nr:hypothetical protein [Fusibacter sp.]
MLSTERMIEIAKECGVSVSDNPGKHYILKGRKYVELDTSVINLMKVFRLK